MLFCLAIVTLGSSFIIFGERGTGVSSLGSSLLISSGLVGPFMLLQWVNRRTFHEDFPFVLFIFMSLHSLFIVLALTPALRRLRANCD